MIFYVKRKGGGSLILLDIDGVCYNMLGALKERNPEFRPEDAYDYALHDTGIDRKKLVAELQNPSVFCMQKLYVGVREGIEKLKTLDTVVGWTMVPESVMPVRKKQLDSLCLDDYKIFTGEKDLKLGDVRAIIEDNPSELDKYKDRGITRVCISRSYNRNYKGFDFMCIDLIDAYERLKEQYESV